jgi:hypothetical protein
MLVQEVVTLQDEVVCNLRDEFIDYIKGEVEDLRAKVSKFIQSKSDFFIRMSEKQFQDIIVSSLAKYCPKDMLEKIFYRIKNQIPAILMESKMTVRHYASLPSEEKKHIIDNDPVAVRDGAGPVKMISRHEVLKNEKNFRKVYPRHTAETEPVRLPEDQGKKLGIAFNYFEIAPSQIDKKSGKRLASIAVDEYDSNCLILLVVSKTNETDVIKKVRVTKEHVREMMKLLSL